MLRCRLGERGGVALVMVVVFMVMAVPLTTAALKINQTLSIASRVYDKRLEAQYNSGAGAEAALHKILTDPNFDVGLTPSNPSKVILVPVGDETVTVTVTKIFTSASASVAGQGLVVSKTVTPTTTAADTLTTYTYTITIKNEGTGAQEIMEIKDFAPPGFEYLSGSTGGDITSADPLEIPGGAGAADHYLNDTSSAPYPWDIDRGTGAVTGSHTPAQSVWEEIPEYWETAVYSNDGVLRATQWTQKQWIKGANSANKWRWKVELVRGGVPTALFTSIDGFVSTSWVEKQIDHSPGDISILSGDKLRLHIEVFAPSSIASERLVEYRWGGDEVSGPDYDSRTKIPQIEYCNVGPQYELQWILSPNVQIQPQEELTLTFQVTSTVPDGTYYNQVEVKYDPWWTSPGIDVKTGSPQTAPIAVGTGTPSCLHGAGLRITQSVAPQEVEAGVQTEFTYTVNIENISPQTLWICEVRDWLPATFTYVYGSPTGAIARDPDNVNWKADEERYELKWVYDEDDGYMFPIDAAQTKSFAFKALGTVEQGMIYANEVKEVRYSYVNSCAEDGGGKAKGGTDPNSTVTTKGLYDLSAVAADGSVLSRVLFNAGAGTVDILSWQEYN